MIFWNFHSGVLLLWATLLSQHHHVANAQLEVIRLSSEELYEMSTTGQIDLMIDTRTSSEWATGHIENATFVNSLQTELSQASDYEATLKSLNLWGCRYCRVAVYCRSGARAGAALDLLLQAGFEGQLYNGLGVSQWTAAGYPLVGDPSKDDLPCMVTEDATAVSKQAGVCRQLQQQGQTQVEEFAPDQPENTAETYEMHQNELEIAKDLFLAQMEVHNATAYSFEFTQSCFCFQTDYPWVITSAMQQLMMGVKPNVSEAMTPIMMVNPVHTLTGDAVLSAVTSTGEDITFQESESFVKIYSILDLFDKIEGAIDAKADEIRVAYNSEFGYPEDIFIDYNYMMADEEFSVAVSNFNFVDLSLFQDDGEGGGCDNFNNSTNTTQLQITEEAAEAESVSHQIEVSTEIEVDEGFPWVR